MIVVTKQLSKKGRKMENTRFVTQTEISSFAVGLQLMSDQQDRLFKGGNTDKIIYYDINFMKTY